MHLTGSTPTDPDLWRLLTSFGISHCGCRGGLSHHRIVMADGNTTGLTNNTSGVLAANLWEEKSKRRR